MSNQDGKKIESGEQDDKSVRVLYIGNDLSYWKNVKTRFKKEYSTLPLVFSHLEVGEAVNVKEKLPEVIANKSKIIFLDYAFHAPEIMRLGHDIRRECSLRDVVVVGLLESLESKHLITLSLSLGIYLNLVKSAELSSIAHHPMVIAYPLVAKNTNYAVAKIEFLAQAFSQIRVSYFTDQYVHIESSHNFPLEKELHLKTSFFVDCKLSGNFKVVRAFEDNIYSTHSHAYDIAYNHMDMEGINRAKINLDASKTALARDPKNNNLKYDVSHREGEVNQALDLAKTDAKERDTILKEWIKTFANEDKAKRTRVLIIDKEMEFLKQHQKHTDSHTFSIQYHSRADDEVLRKVRPGIIAFSLEMHVAEAPSPEVKEGEVVVTPEQTPVKTGPKNDLNELQKICEIVKKQGSSPFVLVFNVTTEHKAVKEAVPYERLMVTSDKLTIESIAKFAQMYEAKKGRTKTHDQAKSYGSKEKRSYVNKFDAKALALFQFPISVKELSETELIFECDEHVPFFSMLYVKRPVKMTITVVPPREGGVMKLEKDQYYGLVSGLGEVELAELRKYINQLFFTELEEKKRQEKSEVEVLKQQKAKEKAQAEALAALAKKESDSDKD